MQSITVDESSEVRDRGWVEFELQNLSQKKLGEIQVEILRKNSGEISKSSHVVSTLSPKKKSLVLLDFEPIDCNTIDIVVKSFSVGSQTIRSRAKHTIDLISDAIDVIRTAPKNDAPKTDETRTDDLREVGPAPR